MASLVLRTVKGQPLTLEEVDGNFVLLDDNNNKAMSCSAGTTFPTTDLKIGMLCWRTDLEQLYILKDLTPTWIGIASAIIKVDDGTAAAPSFTFKSDTDTGIYRDGNNTLGFSTAGTKKLTIDPDGNVTLHSGYLTSNKVYCGDIDVTNNISTFTVISSGAHIVTGPNGNYNFGILQDVEGKFNLSRYSKSNVWGATILQVDGSGNLQTAGNAIITGSELVGGSLTGMSFIQSQRATYPLFEAHKPGIAAYGFGISENNYAAIMATTGSGTWSSTLAEFDSTGNGYIFGDHLYVGLNKTASFITMGDTDNGERHIHCNSNRIGFLNSSGDWGSWCDDSGYFQSDTSVRAPIFYDSANTAYYCDPNSLSLLSSIRVDAGVWGIQSSEGYGRAQFISGSTSYWRGYGSWFHVFMDGDATTRAIFEGAGNLYCTGNVTAYWSDSRLKQNVTTLTNSLDVVQKLRGVEFEWNEKGCNLHGKTPGVKEIGFIAQEVQEVVPDAVAENVLGQAEDGSNYLTVKKDALIPHLVEAIKELKNMNDTLLSRIEKLESKIIELESK